jgi:histone deacetylase 1/2
MHVDDKEINSDDDAELEKFIQALQKRFKRITNMTDLNRYIGITLQLEKDTNHLCLSQNDIVNEFLAKHVKNGVVKLAPVPLDMNHGLNDRIKSEPTLAPVWEDVGSIRYIADHTRFDLCYAASLVGQHAHKPQDKDVKAIRKIAEYLNSTRDLQLKLGGRDTIIKLFAYCDSSFIRDGDSLPHHGICIFLSLDAGAVLCISRKGKMVVLSSTEGELDCLTECIKEIIWIRGLLNELGFIQMQPTVIYQDNKSTIKLSNMVSILPRTRYLANRLNFVRQEIQDHRTVTLKFLPSEKMVADILTKALPKSPFEKFREILLHGHDNVEPEDKSNVATVYIQK